MHSQAYLLLAIGLSNLIFGSLIVLRNTRDLINLFFGGFVVAATLWSFGLAGYIFTSSSDTAVAWAREYYLAAAAIPPLFLGFSLNFTRSWYKLKNSYILASLIPVAFVAMIVLVPGYLINGIRRHAWGKEVILNQGGYWLYTLYFVLFVGAAFVIIYRSLKKSEGQMRLNLQFIFAGMLAAFLLGMTFNLFYPAAGNYRFIWVGPLSILVYIGVMSYAMVRHRLFDIRFFVVRAVAYSFTLTVIGLLFVLPTFFITNNLFHTSLDKKTLAILALVTLAVSYLFQPLRSYFNKITNRIFYRDYYEPQDVLDKISNVLVGNASVQDIEIQCATIMMDALRPTRLSFVLHNDKSPERQSLLTELIRTRQEIVNSDNLNPNSYSQLQERMRADDIAQAVRLQTAHGILGFMLLGYKKSGGVYSGVDDKLLAIAADDIAVGLQNALRFEQISQFNITLKQKVDEATAELKQANTHLQELDVIKDEFISMATHQLGTPLTVIDGYLSMVIEDRTEKDAKDAVYLQQALRRVRLMKRLVADFLNVSRIEAGRFVIERSPTDLNKLVPEEIEQLLQKARDKGVTVEFVAPKNPLPLANIDEQKTRQAIMNLVDNAIFYTPKGMVKVYLECDGENAVFKVVDNGIGVPEIQKDKLFTKFMRADNAKKERPDGTGIGLYLVKRVIEDQGGQIIFKSLEGEGSTFGFSLPLGSVPQTALVEAPTSDSQPKPLQPALEYQDLEPEPIAKPTSAAVEPKKVIRKKYYTIQ